MTRGQKRYELSNHLGNVHVVVSDRKKTECSGNTFSAYEPEIINTYDYYPFGMLMEERKGQKPECTTSSSTTTKTPYNYVFGFVDEGFAAVGTNVTLDQSTSALAVDRNSATTATGWGASKGGHNLVKGVTYTLSYQLQGAAPSGYTTTVGRTVQVRLKWGASVMASGTLTLTSAMQSGSFNYTADYTGAYTIEIVYTGAAIAKGRFLADNVKITYNSQLTTVNCGTAEKYLYGFNGQMKDDEVYGVEGTSYSFEYRVYDSRIGRFLSVDPLARNFAWNSPYAFAENDVIRSIDLEGTEKVVVTTTSQNMYSLFLKVTDVDDVLKGQLHTPITKPEYSDKINIYVISSDNVELSATLNPKVFKDFIYGSWLFTQLNEGEKNKLRESDPEKYTSLKQNSGIIQENGLDYNKMYEDFIAGKIAYGLIVSKDQEEDDQVKSLSHEIKLHLINMLNGVSKTAEEEHKEGFGDKWYQGTTDARISPSHDETPPNSVMGKIYTRIDKAIEKIKAK